jgi:hypothetical protein
MTDETELEARAAELRRLVYGTPGGHESDAVTELVEVEHALAKLRETSAESASGAPVGTRTSTGRAAPTPALAEDPEDATDSSERTPRARRMVLAGAAALVVAVVAGAALAIGPIRDLAEPPRGLEIFDRARGDEDAGPRGSEIALGARAVETIRHIGRVVGFDVWVFRDGTDVCMIVQRDERSGWGANCVDEAVFLDRGIRQLISSDELIGRARPAELEPGTAVELEWSDESVEVEWSVVPISDVNIDPGRIWVPASPEGSTPMTYEEWSSARLAARLGGS